MLLLALPLLVLAPLPDLHVVHDDDIQPIAQGSESEGCQFPTTVLFDGCTGVLVSPRVVLTAAHCMAEPENNDPTDALLGLDIDAPLRSLPMDRCKKNPAYNEALGAASAGSDIAYCILEEPVYDIPPTPVVYGCETEIIAQGRDAWIVGGGHNRQENGENVGLGLKRHLQATIGAPANKGSLSGGTYVNGQACVGDSGGPAYVQFPDGSWHVFGVAAWGPTDCGAAGFTVYAVVSEWVQWIEEDSGFDITPCHEADGTWAPTGWCQGFEADALNPDGDWETGCATKQSGPSTTCGSPFDASGDDVAPTVFIDSPESNAEVDDAPALIDISVVTDDMDGSGTRTVRLVVDGEVEAENREEPFGFQLQFSEGVYELEAVAEDWAGNVGVSEVVRIGVGVELPPTGAETSGTGTGGPGDTGELSSTTGDWTSSEDSGSSSPQNNDSETETDGCSCRSGSGPWRFGLWLFAGLALLRRRS